MRGCVAFCVGLCVVIASVSADGPRTDELCAATLCSTQRPICRVVLQCLRCPPQSACLDCVPKGVDAVCNRNRYFYAVLVGSAYDPRSLTALTCNPNVPNDLSNCPDNTVCIPDDMGSGNCCFGKPDPTLPYHEILPATPVCPPPRNRCGRCRDGYVCKENATPCRAPPCRAPTFSCVPINKPGDCAVLPAYVPSDCQPPVSRCQYDYNCPGNLKCCRDLCSNFNCVPPFSK